MPLMVGRVASQIPARGEPATRAPDAFTQARPP